MAVAQLSETVCATGKNQTGVLRRLAGGKEEGRCRGEGPRSPVRCWRHVKFGLQAKSSYANGVSLISPIAFRWSKSIDTRRGNAGFPCAACRNSHFPSAFVFS